MRPIRILQAGLLCLAICTSDVYGQPGRKLRKAPGKVHEELLKLKSILPPQPDMPEISIARDDKFLLHDGMVGIEAVSTEATGAALLAQLQAIGLQQGSYYNKVVSGFLPIDQIDNLNQVSLLHYVSPAYEPIHASGSTVSQGDVSLRANLTRSNYAVNGMGSKVGILSDSYNARNGAANGIASGNLPADMQVLLDAAGSSLTDEGRAMAEIVYDVAPGAKQAFHTALTGIAGYANGIRALADAGCNIIVDDIAYLNEPFFQDGIIAQAVDEVAARKVTYFSAAGNHRDNSYEAPFVNAGFDIANGWGQPHNFGNGDWLQTIRLAPGQSIRLVLQWDDPFFSVTGDRGTETDLDVLFFFNGVLLPQLSALSDNIASKDPYEILSLRNNGVNPITFEIAISKYTGPDPNYIKWVNFANGSFPLLVEYLNNASTIVGHANAKGAIAVGSSAWFNTPAYNANLSTAVINNASSRGGTPVFFSTDGKRTGLGEGKYRNKPEIVAPDAGNTSFFGTDITLDADNFPNFSGTSAAAPHAAAVAALMQEVRNNTLNPENVLSIMRESALDMDDPLTAGVFDKGFDLRTGAGFIQADRCVDLAGGKLITKKTAARQQAPQVAKLTTWPNPSTGLVTLNGTITRGSQGMVTITNFSGQQIMKMAVPAGSWQKRISLGQFGRGMYMVQMNNGDEIITQKILVQ